MAVIELEIWSDDKESDYARLLTELEEDTADELYEYLYSTARDWCDDHDISPEALRRTTGKDVQLANVLQWYMEEGLLMEVEVDGETAYLPAPPVQDKLERDVSKTALVPIDN
ncbi:hypothetical protein ACFOZ7_15415 [Natribaculum luteum]|uniref:Uncharacterized protein n=1 Tax=Natribaculum luteum TaxID=1586232 RepID=A0ABD5P285_9EURY|nr:hypothetical protein [Natribaculum luteum]